MKKNKTAILLLCMLVVFIGVATVLGLYLYREYQEKSPRSLIVNAQGMETFANTTDRPEFKDIPMYQAKGVKVTEPEDRGDNVYMAVANGTNKEQYEGYLQTLQDAGFTFFADNGEDGLDKAVYTASFTGKEVTVTVTYIVNEETVYITSSANMELSPHLIDKEEYRANIIDGMKNKVYMFELYDYGNSFLIQLKNGHYIVSDGGRTDDIKYLVDYMEQFAPNGEKPVVEAWFVTHAHADHQGALASLTSEMSVLDRIYIDGIYLSMPSDEAFTAVNQLSSKTAMMMIQTLPNYAKASDGGSTKIYRPQTGQKYYFCDIVVDITHSQEQLVTQDYANLDLNDSSLWTMFNIDGQKFLLAGDADKGAMRVVMKNYSQEYFDVEVYASLHHNLNNWFPFLEYMKFKTVLFTTSGTESQNKKVGEINSAGSNAFLKENALDYYSWEDGGKVLTFPYETGTAETLPMQEWKYHSNRERTY